MQLEHTYLQTNGVRLHVVQTGPQSGPLVILLHGFPEFWYGWRHQIDALAAVGYRVWAPDQRGYNLSDKPPGVAAYNVDQLAQDVVGLIDAAGVEKAYLIGHDWGAGVTWWTAIRYPQRLHKLAILNVPHPAVVQTMLSRSLTQLHKSWYIFFFQLPWLPERSLAANNFANMIGGLQGSSNRGSFTDADLELYRAAWGQPGALTGMLNWYRAFLRQRPTPVRDLRIHLPTLMIWGVNDVALGRDLAQPSIEQCDQGRLVLLEEATHWVQHDAPARVTELLVEHLQN
jgi:epoxide hydrolase 4